MESATRVRPQAFLSAKPSVKLSTKKIEDNFLDRVMHSVSASLDKMTKEEQEQSVLGAERAVDHLR
jgi:hypothetical protein